MAVEDLLLAEKGALPWSMGYWLVRDQGFHKPLLLANVLDDRIQADAQWQNRREQLQQVLAAQVRGIRAGEFPIYNADRECTSRCDFSTVCRVNQIRALDKTWPAEETKR